MSTDLTNASTREAAAVSVKRTDERRLLRRADGHLRPGIVHGAVMVVALAGFGVSLRPVDPGELGVLGLASVLPPTTWVALGLLLIGYAIAAVFHPGRGVLSGYVLSTVAAFHALPALVYEYPRFPWAWKHVGIVDFIQRHNFVDPTIDSMNVYHGWPGFFGLSTLVTETAGLEDPLALVAWAPLLFNLAFVGGLVLLFRSFTDNPAWIWTGALLFSLANWIGQDYFAPQAIAYLWYLLVVAFLLKWFARRPAHGSVSFPDLRSQGNEQLVNGLLVLLLTAIVVSHQLTPVMMILAAAGLVVLRSVRVWWPALVTAALLVVWMVDFAFPFTIEYVPKIVRDLTEVTSRVQEGLIDYERVDASQRAVSLAARAVTLTMGGLGVWGLARILRSSLRQTFPWMAAIALLAAPVVMVGASSYGNEILFRAYFFALPMFGLLAAALWFGRDPRHRLLAVTSLSLVLLAVGAMSLIAKHGNDVRTTFRPGEVEAASHMYEIAPPGTMVIQLSSSAPIRFKNYENITEVAVEAYSDQAKQRVVADPAGRFARWAIDGDFNAAYVFLTDSQEAAISRLGRMPPGSYETVMQSLRRSPRYTEVFSNEQAVLFQLNPHELD